MSARPFPLRTRPVAAKASSSLAFKQRGTLRRRRRVSERTEDEGVWTAMEERAARLSREPSSRCIRVSTILRMLHALACVQRPLRPENLEAILA